MANLLNDRLGSDSAMSGKLPSPPARRYPLRTLPAVTLATRAFLACLALAVVMPVAYAAGGAHVHGTAEIDVAIDGGGLQIELHSPLDNLIGFEHAPRTDREKRAVEDLRGKLMQAERLFALPPAAGCVAQPGAVDMPFTRGDAAGKGERTTKDGHAEIHASFVFRCRAPEALQGIDFRLFDLFPGIARAKVQLAGPRGQSAATLTPRRRLLSW